MSIHKEAKLVDLNDEQLKEFLGHTYHAIKNIEEEKKNDPEIAQLRDKLNAYVKDVYDDELKERKTQMKAARALASARGIKWACPTDADYQSRKVREAVEKLRNPDGKGETQVFWNGVQVGGPKE